VLDAGMRWLAKRTLSESARRWLRVQCRRGEWAPPVGFVRFGSLRRLSPISREYGFDRGMPIDPHYIETFLARHAGDVAGDVLEIKDDGYTRRFGGDRVRKSDVLCLEADDPHATIVGDLVAAPQIPTGSFDCAIVTQTLQFVYDAQAAFATLHRILSPGGVLLATVPGIGTPSNISLSFLEKDRVEIVTGVNLPMLIKIAGLKEQAGLLAVAREMREHGRNAIWVASDLLRGEKA